MGLLTTLLNAGKTIGSMPKGFQKAKEAYENKENAKIKKQLAEKKRVENFIKKKEAAALREKKKADAIKLKEQKTADALKAKKDREHAAEQAKTKKRILDSHQQFGKDTRAINKQRHAGVERANELESRRNENIDKLSKAMGLTPEEAHKEIMTNPHAMADLYQEQQKAKQQISYNKSVRENVEKNRKENVVKPNNAIAKNYGKQQSIARENNQPVSPQMPKPVKPMSGPKPNSSEQKLKEKMGLD